MQNVLPFHSHIETTIILLSHFHEPYQLHARLSFQQILTISSFTLQFLSYDSRKLHHHWYTALFLLQQLSLRSSFPSFLSPSHFTRVHHNPNQTQLSVCPRSALKSSHSSSTNQCDESPFPSSDKLRQ